MDKGSRITPDYDTLSNLLFAYPEGCDDTLKTPIRTIDYVHLRRTWMQNVVRTCGSIGISLSRSIFDVAFMDDVTLKAQRKPQEVKTWYDAGAELDRQIETFLQ